MVMGLKRKRLLHDKVRFILISAEVNSILKYYSNNTGMCEKIIILLILICIFFYVTPSSSNFLFLFEFLILKNSLLLKINVLYPQFKNAKYFDTMIPS